MRIPVLLVLLSVSAGVQAKTLLEHVALLWKPTSDLQLGTTQMSQAPIQFESFKDRRENPTAIGENDEDDKPKPVTTNEDVGAFVSDHMRKLFDQAGLKTVAADGAVTIKGEVTQFFVRETSTYKSQVEVRLTVIGRDGKTPMERARLRRGDPLWSFL